MIRARYTFTIDVTHEDYNTLDELLNDLDEYRTSIKNDMLTMRAFLYDPELDIDVELTSVEDLGDEA